MTNYKIPRLESADYLAWVRTLPCANCGSAFKSDAHHRIGHGRVSTVKVSDYEAMPLCARCHGLLHNQGWRVWEEANRPQHQMIVETLIQALREEAIQPNTEMLKRMAKYG